MYSGTMKQVRQVGNPYLPNLKLGSAFIIAGPYFFHIYFDRGFSEPMRSTSLVLALYFHLCRCGNPFGIIPSITFDTCQLYLASRSLSVDYGKFHHPLLLPIILKEFKLDRITILCNIIHQSRPFTIFIP